MEEQQIRQPGFPEMCRVEAPVAVDLLKLFFGHGSAEMLTLIELPLPGDEARNSRRELLLAGYPDRLALGASDLIADGLGEPGEKGVAVLPEIELQGVKRLRGNSELGGNGQLMLAKIGYVCREAMAVILANREPDNFMT